MPGVGGVPEFLLLLESFCFCELGAHANFVKPSKILTEIMDIFSDFVKAYFYFCLFLFLLPPLLRILEHGDGQLKLARPK